MLKRFFSSLFLVLVALLATAQEPKPTLVYIFDPTCSWCYAFNHEMLKLHANFKHKLNFSVVSGGMFVGEHVRPISDISEFVLEGYKDMENSTDAEFGEPYIQMVKNGKEVLDSERPSFAFVAFRDMYPEKTIDFIHDLQTAHFLRGKSYNQDSIYLILAKKYGIDGSLFLQKMNSDSIKTETRADFKQTEDAGIDHFPALLLKVNDEVFLVSEGFEKYGKIEKRLNKQLGNARK